MRSAWLPSVRFGRPRLGQTVIASLQRRGAIIPIQIGLPQAAVDSARAAGGVPPAMEELAAMIDTGASITAINLQAAARLGLIATGSVQVAGVTGVSEMPIFGARIVMPEPGFTFDPIEIAGANLNAPDFDVLIGRNMMCHLILTYDGRRGLVSLSK